MATAAAILANERAYRKAGERLERAYQRSLSLYTIASSTEDDAWKRQKRMERKAPKALKINPAMRLLLSVAAACNRTVVDPYLLKIIQKHLQKRRTWSRVTAKTDDEARIAQLAAKYWKPLKPYQLRKERAYRSASKAHNRAIKIAREIASMPAPLSPSGLVFLVRAMRFLNGDAPENLDLPPDKKTPRFVENTDFTLAKILDGAKRVALPAKEYNDWKQAA